MHRLLQWLNRCLLIGFVMYGVIAIAFLWQIRHYPDLSSDQYADGLVILTGGTERVDEGVAVLQRGQAKRVLISGVHPDVKLPELVALHHIPQHLVGQIDLGFGAIDTAGNAQETVWWVKDHDLHSLIVVTSNYHMPRALLHLHSVLPHTITLIPLAVVPTVLDQPGWYRYGKAWSLLFLAYNKYLLTWPEILLWRYKT